MSEYLIYYNVYARTQVIYLKRRFTNVVVRKYVVFMRFLSKVQKLFKKVRKKFKKRVDFFEWMMYNNFRAAGKGTAMNPDQRHKGH